MLDIHAYFDLKIYCGYLGFLDKKFGKTRAIFSAKFWDATLNKNFIFVPDLESQITVAIKRFQKDPVIIIGDIEIKFQKGLLT